MMEVETCQVGLALATLAVSQKAELDLVPVKFRFDHVPKTCPKRSILARLNNQNCFQKTSCKCSTPHC